MTRPSSLPILKECAKFESEGSEFADLGKMRHDCFARALQGDESLYDMLPEEDAEGVKWAVEQVRLHAPMHDYPLELEKQVEGTLPNFTEMRGTADVVCGPYYMADLKWRERNYIEQYAAYALLQILKLHAEPVRFHALYAATKTERVHEFTRESAWAIIEPVLANAGVGAETPCDYCKWCSKCATCPELNKRAQAVMAGREDWELSQYHASQIDTADEMAKAFTLAWYLEDWCKAVYHYAEEMWFKKGVTIPGLIVKTKQGRQYVSDAMGAYKALGLPPEEFIRTCVPRLNTSKTYPDQVGIIETYKKQNGIPTTAAAKRAVEQKIGEFIKRGRSTDSLAPIKSTKTKTEEE